MKDYARRMWLVGVVLLTCACATPVGVTHVNTQSMYRSVTSSVLSAEQPEPVLRAAPDAPRARGALRQGPGAGPGRAPGARGGPEPRVPLRPLRAVLLPRDEEPEARVLPRLRGVRVGLRGGQDGRGARRSARSAVPAGRQPLQPRAGPGACRCRGGDGRARAGHAATAVRPDRDQRGREDAALVRLSHDAVHLARRVQGPRLPQSLPPGWRRCAARRGAGRQPAKASRPRRRASGSPRGSRCR